MNIDEFEMFRVGCGFSGCANLCLAEQEKQNPQFLRYTTPAVVNAALACEVFLKLLLHFSRINFKKIHHLYDLFENLPVDIKQEVKGRTINRYGKWENIWGKEYLFQISKAFSEWRYIYEHDWSESSVKKIEIGFLLAFRDSLQEICSKRMEQRKW